MSFGVLTFGIMIIYKEQIIIVETSTWNKEFGGKGKLQGLPTFRNANGNTKALRTWIS